MEMSGFPDPLRACSNSGSHLRTPLQTHSSNCSLRSLHCDPWEKQGLERGTQGAVADCLKWLLARFQVSCDACFVDLHLGEQSQYGKHFFQQSLCVRAERGILGILAHVVKPTHKVPLHLLLGLKQVTFSGAGETRVETPTCLLQQIFDFLTKSPQQSPQI